MIGLSEPVASLQFPHLATSRGCAEWFREKRKYPASSGSLAHNALLGSEEKGRTTAAAAAMFSWLGCSFYVGKGVQH